MKIIAAMERKDLKAIIAIFLRSLRSLAATVLVKMLLFVQTQVHQPIGELSREGFEAGEGLPVPV